ncbi:MAG: hypothetical protein KAI79_03805 [Bacteroidales bacterium]|nr:hypothetical protein [Bacteroidales bacterium]
MNIKQLFLINSNIKSYLALFFIALFMLAANPFKSETIAPMDLLVKYPGWQNTHIEVDYIHGERSDILDAKLPIWVSAKHDLYKGDLPIWNHQRAGKPGLTFTNSLLTPAFVTFALFENDALGFYLSNLVNVLIGLIGMYLFLRLFLGQSASIFGAFIFMFSGFNAAWFFWAHVDTAVWTPWVLFSVYQYISTQKQKYLPLVTGTMLMLNLGGFPMVAVMTYMSVAIMVFIFFISNKTSLKRMMNILWMLALFSLLSVMIAVPFIYPLVELLEWMGGIGYRHGGNGFSLRDFELFINPNLYRSPKVETTFYVGILPLLFLILSIVFYIIKPKFIAIFGLVLFLYSITIAFTLIDPDIIHKIPTLNSSLLTRFGYLIGLSLAIVSAYTLNVFIEKFKHTKWVYFVIIILFGIQFMDQGKLFHTFNNAVPNKSFYPQTKSISYLQNNLQPFQHVMADSGYLISGTLGGYGLNDWYAHSFHTAEEKEVLRKLVNKPFKTPTSAMFTFSQINLESPYMDYLGIKSILTTTLSMDSHIPLWDNQRKAIPSPVLPTNTLLQKFRIDAPIQINGIVLKMAIYGEVHASSDIQLTLMKDNIPIEKSIVKKEIITDNKWVPFNFQHFSTLEKGNYSITIKMTDTTQAKPLTVWSNIGEQKYPLSVNGKAENISLKMALSQKRVFDEKYNILNLEPNIHIIENLNIQGGAYFLPTLDTSTKVDYTQTKTKLLSNTEIEIIYSGDHTGWIVLPMRSYPGWVATINEKEVEITKFLGMLPAMKVNNRSTILLTYKPSYNTYTYLLSLLGLIILLFSIFKFRRKD